MSRSRRAGRRHAREPRLGPPARRHGPSRADAEGGRPRRRHGRRGPRAGRGDRRRAREDPLPARAEGLVGRGPAGRPRLEPGAGARPARVGRADRRRHVGPGAVVGRAPRPAPQGDRRPRPRHRLPAPVARRAGRALARPMAVSLPLRRAGRRRLFAAPHPSPRGPGQDSAPVGVAAARPGSAGQGDLLRADDRGGRRPRPAVGPRRARRGRPRLAVLAPDPPARGRRAGGLKSSGTAARPRRR